MVTLETAENALKTLYLGVVSNQLNTKTNPLFNKIKQSTADVWGKEVKKLAPVGINGGIGAGDEDGSLPTSAQNNYITFTSTLKNLFGTIELSDKAIRASSNSAGAFVNLLNAEMEGLVKASQFNFGRMLYGDGSGLLALGSRNTGFNNSCIVDSVKNLMEGMVVDISKFATIGTTVATARITSIDRNGKIVYFDKNVEEFCQTDGEDSNIVLTVQNSYNKEITGLGKIFAGDNSELYGLDRNNYSFMNPLRNDSVSELTDIVMQKMVDELNEYYGSEIDFIVCSSSVKRKYQEYLNSFRTNIDVMQLEGGYKAISFNGIPLISDRFVKDGEMYMLNTKDFTLHQLCDWRWLEGENGKVLKQVAGKPVYTATLVKYAELICDHPAGQGALINIPIE